MSQKAQNGHCKNKIANTLNTSFSPSDNFLCLYFIYLKNLFDFSTLTLEELQSLMIYQKVAKLSYSF